MRGVQVAKQLTDKYTLHLYDGISARGDRKDPRVPKVQAEAVKRNRDFMVSANDVWTLRRLNEADLI